MPLDKTIRKVLVIGSGPIVIGQAAEFDYAGAQACRVLKQAGVNVVLVNSNPATIMTDRALADEIYLEPLTVDSIKRILEKERPDSILAGLGGQTGLTLAMKLSKDDYLEKMGIRLLGTNAEAIDKAEDRQLFKDTMESINEPTIASDIATDVEHALEIAARIGYPIIVRPAFTLGGTGGGVAYDEVAMRDLAQGGLDASPIRQILVEKYIFGWKEIEFETVRDAAGNAIAVCSMENVDAVGIHTGDSIVVAPALTLSPKEYQLLRNASLKIVEALGIVGGCNCQYALNPDSFEYAVIEVNPRVSRSSALASKATGYPIAKIATKIALGYTLDEIQNDITGKTCACFEPSVDYCVVKFPKWPFDKFVGASRTLGTQMKATGEVMSIAPSFEMALMKAIRGAEIGLDSLNAAPLDAAPLEERLARLDDRRLFTVFEALKAGYSVEQIASVTRIDPWFLCKMQKLARFEEELGRQALSKEAYEKGKRFGYTDKTLCRLAGVSSTPYSRLPVYKMVDTCAAEFGAVTPYFYATMDERCEARSFRRSGKETVLVLGSGPIRIGQGIEFDYSSVHCVWTLKEMGYDVVIINNNPETVSTDYDTADRLYFEPLTEEDVAGIIAVEKPIGVVVAFGGQTAIKLTRYLHDNGIRILGTSAESIDMAEDRERFDKLLETVGIRRPPGGSALTVAEAVSVAEQLNYPVLLRPSYVIGGQNMTIAYDAEAVRTYMTRILKGGIENAVWVDKYMGGTEIEVDVISDGKDVLIPGVMEHIERAGVHSGDSIAVYPPYNLSDRMMQTVVSCSEKLALALGTQGLINIQYLISEGELYVIEVNPRASRTVPYISKVTEIPMVDLAAKVMLGQPLASLGYGTGLAPTPPYYAVKVPVFSFEKLTDVNSNLGPEMKSTGEVLGVGRTLNEALFKGLTSAGTRFATERGKTAGVLLSVDEHDEDEMLNIAKKLDDLGIRLYATPDTAAAISTLGIDVVRMRQIRESNEIFELLKTGRISAIIYTGAILDDTLSEYIALHRRALALSIPCFTSVDTANVFADMIASRYSQLNTELVDINHLRKARQKLVFAKMQGCGDDYIFFENFDGQIVCPESLCVTQCVRHTGTAGNGVVLIESSTVADAKMRIFSRDGSEAAMGGNAIRSVGKYLYDSGLVNKEELTIETLAGIRHLKLYTRDHHVTSATVDMGPADFNTAAVPCSLPMDRVVNLSYRIGERSYKLNCLSVGTPQCVVFEDRIDRLNLRVIGPLFENAFIFPERVTTSFVRVVNDQTLRVRVYERGTGETWSCGSAAAASVAAAIENGFCRKNEDITVKFKGGDLIVRVTDDTILLTGGTHLVFMGMTEY